MALPATFQEAEQRRIEADALEYARREFVKYSRPGNPWGEEPLLQPEASREFVRFFLRQSWPLAGPMNRMLLIEWARAGDPVVHEVLASLIIEIKSRHEQLPAELAGYDLEITRDSILSQYRKKAPARKKMSNLLRDICICLVVAGICDRFRPLIKATGSSSRRRSACSIAGEALGAVGMEMDGETVVTIWKKMKGGMPTVPGWAWASPE
jgi:hypothetical protein